MSVREQVVLAALSIGLLGAWGGGCDRDSSRSTPPAAPQASSGGAAADNPGADADATGDDAPAHNPGDAPVSAANGPPIPTPDIPVPPSAEGEVARNGFVSFAAKEQAAPLGEFYKKELGAKGWKLGRNETSPLSGTTLTGVVQQYDKGSDVLTVVLTEQPATEGTVTMASVMDIPLPPKTSQIVVFGAQALIQNPEPPDATLAWFNKELTARGWSAGRTSEAGDSKSASFEKGRRTLTAGVRPAGGGKPGSSVQLMHIAYTE